MHRPQIFSYVQEIFTDIRVRSHTHMQPSSRNLKWISSKCQKGEGSLRPAPVLWYKNQQLLCFDDLRFEFIRHIARSQSREKEVLMRNDQHPHRPKLVGETGPYQNASLMRRMNLSAAQKSNSSSKSIFSSTSLISKPCASGSGSGSNSMENSAVPCFRI